MNVYFASDHAGFTLKEMLTAFVKSLGHQVEDIGAHEFIEGDDYPLLVTPCAENVSRDEGSLGIVLGGSGQGEAMAANRVKGIRAAVFYGPSAAKSAIDAEGTTVTDDGYAIVRLEREHNDANILSLGARFLTEEQAKEAVRIFLTTNFSGDPRHVRRIAEF